MTDEILFCITLPQFTARRNKRDPPSLDWSSDGCTSSPDNPFGFPFVPACHRHDFGYRNYKKQSRFSKDNKRSIDDNFKDLLFQCESVSAKVPCRTLANVYYLAVRALGSLKEAAMEKREEQAVMLAQYKAAVEAYEKAVREAQNEGLLHTLEY